MKAGFVKSATLVTIGFVGGIFISDFPIASAAIDEKHTDIEHKSFMVSVNEIKQNFVFAEQFTGSYTKTVTLSDGSIRSIELTPMIHNGMAVVKFKDTGGQTYMGLNGTTTNGNLMVQLRDVEEMNRELKEQGWPLK